MKWNTKDFYCFKLENIPFSPLFYLHNLHISVQLSILLIFKYILEQFIDFYAA